MAFMYQDKKGRIVGFELENQKELAELVRLIIDDCNNGNQKR